MKLFKPNVHDEMVEQVNMATSYAMQVKGLSCPSCNQKKLFPVTVERGEKGWEAKFFCDGCKTKGIINQTGFHVELSYLEGKK